MYIWIWIINFANFTPPGIAGAQPRSCEKIRGSHPAPSQHFC